jgi:hypothetical protein
LLHYFSLDSTAERDITFRQIQQLNVMLFFVRFNSWTWCYFSSDSTAECYFTSCQIQQLEFTLHFIRFNSWTLFYFLWDSSVWRLHHISSDSTAERNITFRQIEQLNVILLFVRFNSCRLDYFSSDSAAKRSITFRQIQQLQKELCLSSIFVLCLSSISMMTYWNTISWLTSPLHLLGLARYVCSWVKFRRETVDGNIGHWVIQLRGDARLVIRQTSHSHFAG